MKTDIISEEYSEETAVTVESAPVEADEDTEDLTPAETAVHTVESVTRSKVSTAYSATTSADSTSAAYSDTYADEARSGARDAGFAAKSAAHREYADEAEDAINAAINETADSAAAIEKIFQSKTSREQAAVKKPPRRTGLLVLRGAGTLSMCLSVLIMAVVLMMCLFVPDFDVTLIAKLSPVAAILTAAELLMAFMKCRGGVRVNIICIAVSAVLMASCLAGGLYIGNSYEEEEKTAVELRLESGIYNACYSELKYVSSISTFKADVVLNSYSPQTDYEINTLSVSDTVSVEVVYKSFSGSKKRFAEQCRTIMDTFKMLNIPVTTYRFSCEDELSRLSLYVEGKYQQDYSADELAELTHEIIAIDKDYYDDVTTEHVSSDDTQDVTTADETYEINIE